MSRPPHYGHDDRNEPAGTSGGRIRKYQNRYKGRRHAGGPAGRFRYEDLDGDVDMSAPAGFRINDRFNPYSSVPQNKRRRNKNRKPFDGVRTGSQGDEGRWFKITILHGKKLEKSFILKSIASLCRVAFVPINFQHEGNTAVFYVSDHRVALSIKDVTRRIITPAGFKLNIQMNRSPPPVCVISPEVKEAIRVCMSKHYNVESQFLNLSKFDEDEDLKANGEYVPLQKPNVFSTVLRIIKDDIPEIKILDLSHNRLYSLEMVSSLASTCKNLSSINLRGNKLKPLNVLNALEALPIVEIVLDGNPLCDEFKDQASYISAVRKKLPKVMRLDGQDLPAPIGFDLGTETVPQTKGSFFPAEDCKLLVVQFLEKFYSIYDSENRDKLLDAYHEQALFSLTITKPSSQSRLGNSLHDYLPESRNLLRMTDTAIRHKLLKQGRLNIVSTLSDLPQTQHDPNSFTVDISLVTPALMSFTVCGVFKEVGRDQGNSPLRSFSRSFVVVPHDSWFVITNETLFITNATVDQVKTFKFAAPTPSPSPAPSGEKSLEEKKQIAIELAKNTGMNIEFSAKCLEEYDWDYQKAATIFSNLNSMGRIPPEAFQK